MATKKQLAAREEESRKTLLHLAAKGNAKAKKALAKKGSK